jgi:hypothetical protein
MEAEFHNPIFIDPHELDISPIRLQRGAAKFQSVLDQFPKCWFRWHFSRSPQRLI